MFSTKQRAVGGITHLVVNMHLVTRKYGNNVTFEKMKKIFPQKWRYYQCWGSVTFWYGSGCRCGSSDPYL
jgi:hypothetical protein